MPNKCFYYFLPGIAGSLFIKTEQGNFCVKVSGIL